MVRPAGAAEYTNCISMEEQDSLDECPGYDTKQSNGEGNVEYFFMAITSWSTLDMLGSYL